MTLRGAAVVAVLLVAAGAAGGRMEPYRQEGPTILFEEGFEDDGFAARGWYDSGPLTSTTEEHRSGRRALEARFTRGAQKPPWGAVRRRFPPSPSVYLSYWVKYSANWRGSGRAHHPHEFSFLTTADGPYAGPAFSHLTAYVEHVMRSGGGVPVVAIQDGRNVDTARIGQDLTAVTEARAVAGCNGPAGAGAGTCYGVGARRYNGRQWTASRALFRSAPGPGYLGDWNHVEAFFRLNTVQGGVGLPDGEIRYWFNGEPVLEVTGVLLRTGAHPDMRFDQFLFAPYFGDGSPVEQTMWVDDIRVGTHRP